MNFSTADVDAIDFTQSIPNCETEITLEYQNPSTSAWEDYTNWEPTFFSSYDDVTGSFTQDSSSIT